MTDTPSTTYGTPPRFAGLPTHTLVVDERYQRSITKDGWKRIRKMAAAFAWQKFGALFVSEGNRIDHAVFDGQHRLEPARPLKLPCIIVDAPDLAAQALNLDEEIDEARAAANSFRDKAEIFLQMCLTGAYKGSFIIENISREMPRKLENIHVKYITNNSSI